jgi:hypothetical protein
MRMYSEDQDEGESFLLAHLHHPDDDVRAHASGTRSITGFLIQ